MTEQIERSERTEGLSPEDIVAALAEFARGGPDRTEECLRLGADPRVVAKAREAAEQWQAQQALEERVAAKGAGIAERLPPETPKVGYAEQLEAATAKQAAGKAVARPKAVGWVAELEAAEGREARIEAGLRIVAEGRAAEGQVAEELERLCGAWREFRQRSAKEPVAEAKPSAAVVRLISKQQAKPEPEASNEAPAKEAKAVEAVGWLPPFASETPLAHDPADPAVLSVAGSYDNAREYARRFCFSGGWLAMYYWREKFWRWNGRVYEPLGMEELRSAVYRFLDESWKREVNKKGDGVERVRFRPAPKDVNNLVDGLKSGLVLRADCDPPTWLDSGLKASEVLMFRNGLVEVMTEKRVETTPRLWMHSALDYDWNPKAECPGWLKFLEDVFPGDSESQDCVEEALGYSMTEDTRFMKGVLLVGLSRSGKGTIATKVLRKLVGSAAFVSLNFHQWTATENSREDLIGKKVGVFPDVRLKPPKWFGQTLDPGGMDHRSTELVLAITTGDPVSVRTKYQVGAWHGILPTKLWLVSNTVPNFNDPVLPSRFVKLAFGVSFLGREDIGLARRLEAEAEGIAVRCLAAYRRLVRRDRFIQPKAGLELERAIGESSDPFTQFAKDTFVLDFGSEVTFTDAWIKFETWCDDAGRADLRKTVTKRNFTAKLREVPGFGEVGRYRPHGAQRRITGVRWRRQAEREDD